MTHHTLYRTHSRRGAAAPALKVTLVAILLVAAFAVGFLKLGPAWKNARQTAGVANGTGSAASSGAATFHPKSPANTPAPKTDEPKVVSVDTPLASVHIVERPGPGGNVIPRTESDGSSYADSQESGDGAAAGTTPTTPSGESDKSKKPPADTSIKKPTDKPTDKPVDKPADKTPAKPPTVKTPPADTSAGDGKGLFRVQIGLFMERANAERTLAEAVNKGFEASLAAVPSGGRTFYRVQAGAFTREEAARDRASELRKAGFTPTIEADTE